MKQEFRASRHHLTTVFPVASPPSTGAVVAAATVSVSPPPALLPSGAPSGAATAEYEDDDEDDDADDTSSLEDQGSSHSGSSSSRAAGAVTPQAMFLNFTSDLEPHTKSSSKPKKAPTFRVNGVNILNRKNVDSKTAIERMQRRRENHNHVERRRRDNINNTILELSRIIPNAGHVNQKLNKGNVLKLALDYIIDLQKENQKLRGTNKQSGRATDEHHPVSRCSTDLLTHTENSPSHNPPSNITQSSCSAPASPEATSRVLPPLPPGPILHPSCTTDIAMSSPLHHRHRHPSPSSPSSSPTPHLHPHHHEDPPSLQIPAILPPLDFEKLYGNTCRY